MTAVRTVAQLWRSGVLQDDVAAVTPDPFNDPDALAEAQVLDVRLDAVGGLVGVLLELRVALGFEEGEAALLVVRDVESLTWHHAPIAGRHVREVASLVGEGLAGGLRLSLGLGPGQALTCVGGTAMFYVLGVDGLPEAPPDYGWDDEDAVQAGLPQWESSCRVLGAARFPGSEPTTGSASDEA